MPVVRKCNHPPKGVGHEAYKPNQLFLFFKFDPKLKRKLLSKLIKALQYTRSHPGLELERVKPRGPGLKDFMLDHGARQLIRMMNRSSEKRPYASTDPMYTQSFANLMIRLLLWMVENIMTEAVDLELDLRSLIWVSLYVSVPGAEAQSLHRDNVKLGKKYVTVILPLQGLQNTIFCVPHGEFWTPKSGQPYAFTGDCVHAGPGNDSDETRYFMVIVISPDDKPDVGRMDRVRVTNPDWRDLSFGPVGWYVNHLKQMGKL